MKNDQLLDMIIAAQNGDRIAMGKIIDNFAEPIHSFIYHTIGKSNLVEDLAQDTFVKMITNIHQYQPTAPFKAWLYRIALNVCRDHLRKKKVRRIMSSLFPDNWEGEMDIKSNGPLPDQELQIKDSMQHLERIVQKLPKNLKAVFIMRDVQELSYDEIAGILNWQMGTVKSRLYRARQEIANNFKTIENQQNLSRLHSHEKKSKKL